MRVKLFPLRVIIKPSHMRGTRWLLLVAIVAILSGLGLTYRAQKRALRAQSPATPDALPADLNSKSQGFSYSRTNSDHTTLEVSADDMTEAKDSSRADLKGVTLKLYNKSGDAYDLVKSAAATLFKDEHRFYSEGEVEITLAIPKTGAPEAHPITIKSSGVSFDTSTRTGEYRPPVELRVRERHRLGDRRILRSRHAAS